MKGALKVALKSEAMIPYYCPGEVRPRHYRGVYPLLVTVEVDAYFELRYHPGEVGSGYHSGV